MTDSSIRPPLISAGVYPSFSFADLYELADLFDDSRIDTLWVGDSHLIWRECWTTITALATRTSSLRFGSCVSNPISRHASVTASTLATLQELSGGRVRLGIGVGDSALRMTYGRVAKLKELETAVEMIRGLLRGEEYEHDGSPLALARVAPGTEIYVSGSGPKTMAMAGKIGDGAIVVPGLIAARVEQAFAAVATGAAESGRTEAPRRLLWIAFAMDVDRKRALEAVRPWVASVLRHPLPFEISEELKEIRAAIRATYDFTHHMAGSAGHASAVPDHIVQEFAVAGDPDEVGELMARACALDVDEVAFVLMGDDQLGAARSLVSALATYDGVRP
ncbi:MAG: LLM class flavin-dependent oxidoreductase [Actinobacteria bacterium]|nr:LLM class flavin-dependent oxidoreductase [Actinomycetota bacterium]